MAASGGKKLAELEELSARLGGERLLAQGSTGNTSVKLGRTLWIKASGKWLANATSEEMFVPVHRVDLDCLLSSSSSAIFKLPTVSGLAPSIETPMHLVLPHRVVIHLHSVNTIAWAVQRDGPSRLRERLSGLPWCWIRYAYSGLPLARAIRASLRSSPDVFILANHGLVIGAETYRGAVTLLLDIERRLAIEPRKAAKPDRSNLARLAATTDYRLPDSDVIHSLGTDLLSAALVSGGILYPCQAMFLGRHSCVSSKRVPIQQALEEYRTRNGLRPRVILVEGQGVLVAKDLTGTANEVLAGLAQVVQRLPPAARVQYLSERQIAQVLGSPVYAEALPKSPSSAPYPIAKSKAASH